MSAHVLSVGLFAALVGTTPLTLPAQAAPSTPAPVAVPAAASSPTQADPSLRAALRALADRAGLWGSIGLARGSAGLRCATCASAQSYAYGGQAAIGVRLSPRFLVSAEQWVWLDVLGGGVDRSASGTQLVARAYPWPSSRTFVSGGLGVAGYEVDDGTVRFSTRSPSAALGVGRDARVGSVVVTPSVTALASTGGRLTSSRTGNAISEGARLGVLRGSVALSWFR